jgi:hypothetical protein
MLGRSALFRACPGFSAEAIHQSGNGTGLVGKARWHTPHFQLLDERFVLVQSKHTSHIHFLDR